MNKEKQFKKGKGIIIVATFILLIVVFLSIFYVIYDFISDYYKFTEITVDGDITMEQSRNYVVKNYKIIDEKDELIEVVFYIDEESKEESKVQFSYKWSVSEPITFTNDNDLGLTEDGSFIINRSLKNSIRLSKDLDYQIRTELNQNN